MLKKLSVSVSLIILVLVNSMSSGLLTLVYESGLAESYFEQYCVNKNEPSTACHGQCHLHQQLEKTTDESSVPADGSKITFDRDYTLESFSTLANSASELPENITPYLNHYRSLHETTMAQPPEC